MHPDLMGMMTSMEPVPRSRPLYSIPAALARLQKYIDLPRNTREAITLFYQRFDLGILLYLYRRIFPDDYATSQASEEIDPDWNYSPREVEFLEMVDDRLFPLDLHFMSEAGANGDRATEMIYLVPYAMPWWYDAFEGLSLGWQALRLLSGTMTSDEAPQLVATMDRLSPAGRTRLLAASLVMARASPEQFDALRMRFLRRDPPFSGFGQVLALYQYRTGNPWLDTDTDSEILYEGACWCEEHIAEIAQSYQAAQIYEQQVNDFATWLAEDSHRLSQLLALITQELAANDQEAANEV